MRSSIVRHFIRLVLLKVGSDKLGARALWLSPLASQSPMRGHYVEQDQVFRQSASIFEMDAM